MNDRVLAGNDLTLMEMQSLIVRQAAEIARLQQQVKDQQSAQGLREAFTLAATTITIATPVSYKQLLEMIVETAAHLLSAKAAALFLIDETKQELVFEVALGQKAEEVKKFRVPLGHGIAGLTAVSGQPMIVSGDLDDPRRASDIAESVGYIPQSLLCVPLFYNDQVIGVLELLDKQGAATFSPADMEALGLFANQAAVAIEQSRIQRNITALVQEILFGSNPAATQPSESLQEQVEAFVTKLETEAVYRHALDLARLVQELAQQGEDELKLGEAILRSFVEYVRSRPAPAYHFGGA